jgi:DNA-binding transcriptional ArsR family regulator
MVFDCVEFCRTLSDETRQRILRMLADEGEMNVSDVVAAFDVSQPTISHHLNVLKQFGLVTSRKEGKQVFYAINRDRVTECCGRLIALLDVQEAVCES